MSSNAIRFGIGSFLLVSCFQIGASSTLLLEAFPTEVYRNEVVSFKPAKDHHFSLEAPQSCGTGILAQRAARLLQCQFTQVGAVNVTLNVCDDKKTFCKPMPFLVKVTDRDGSTSSTLYAHESVNHELTTKLVPGFKMGAPGHIRKMASESKKPVLVLVTTDWCPACNEAKEFLLPSPEFKEITADWIKVYVDGDSLSSAEWNKVVPYRYYPSFILLNDKFQEIARFPGPLKRSSFVSWSKEALSHLEDPISDLTKRVLARRDGGLWQRLQDLVKGPSAEVRHQDEVRLLRWAFDQNKDELIKKLREGAHFPELDVEILAYDLNQLRDIQEKSGEDKKESRIPLYHRLLDKLSQREGWGWTLLEFCSYDAKACASELPNVSKRLDFQRNRPDLDDLERATQLGEESMAFVELYQLLGKKAEEKKIAEDCVKSYEKVSVKSTLKISRAGSFGLLSCLESSGDLKKVQSLLGPLIEAYPNEATFFLKMARILKKDKKPELALKWAQRADDVAYGYNWFKAQLVKAEVLADLRRKDEARAVVKKSLEQLSLDPSQDSMSQFWAGRLRGLQVKLDQEIASEVRQ